ncbi:MAG: hypothetical protein U0172_01180 [Nitrospiraceae bacterium]
MSDVSAEKVSNGIGLYLRGLKAVVSHLLSRASIAGSVYERMTASSTLPTSVKSVLFLCKGNICRSPLADVYFQHKVREARSPIVVKSAGIETTPGKPAHTFAKEVGQANGISLDRHQTTPLYHELVNQADLVFVMEVAQKRRVLRLYPDAKGKVFVLGQFCARGPLDIDDPYSGTIDDFRVCFDRIRDACDRVFGKLGEPSGTSEAPTPKAATAGSGAD